MRFPHHETTSPQLMSPCQDFTATSILEKFSKQETVQAVERILKLYSAEKAKEILIVRAPTSFEILQ